jgi:hypothetical protein
MNIGRLGLLVCGFGLTLLFASLYTWTHVSYANAIIGREDEFKWVRSDASEAPGLQSNEIWELSAVCTKPYLSAWLEKLRNDLKNHIEAKPEEIKLYERRVQVRRTAKSEPLQKAEEASEAIAVRGNNLRRFMDESFLKDKIKTANRQITNVHDMEYLRSDFLDHMSSGSVLHKFGVNELNEDTAREVYLRCINKSEIKKIVAATHYYTNIGRWPAEHPVAFWIGILATTIGAFLRPLVAWVAKK